MRPQTWQATDHSPLKKQQNHTSNTTKPHKYSRRVMFEQQIFNFGNVVPEEWTVVPLPSPTAEVPRVADGATQTEQHTIGGGQFVGTFDRNGLPIGGGSFMAWRCHGLGTHGSTSVLSLTPTTQSQSVIDIVEIPFTPTTSTFDSQGHGRKGEGEGTGERTEERTGNVDVGSPTERNGGAVRLVIPAEAGHVTGTGSIFLTHETGVSTNVHDESTPGNVTMCVATSCGYLYRIVFPHHPCDVHSVENLGRLRSSLSRSPAAIQLQNVSLWSDESKWTDTNTVLITKSVPSPGPASIVRLRSNWSTVELRPLRPTPESGRMTQLFSWISGTHGQMSKAAPSNLTLSTTPRNAWTKANNGFEHMYHITGTTIDTGIGQVSVVVNADTKNIEKSGIEMWTCVENEDVNSMGGSSDDWVRTFVLEAKDIGPAFRNAVQQPRQEQSMKIQAVAFGENRSMIAVIVSFNEYNTNENGQRHCSTRILRFDGILHDPSSPTPSGSVNHNNEPPLSLFVPANGPETSTCAGVHFDDQRPYGSSPSSSTSNAKLMSETRVVSIHLDVMDIDETSDNAEAVPALTLLVETTASTTMLQHSLLLHLGQYTDIDARIENTLNSTQSRSIERKMNIETIDFFPFDPNEENANEPVPNMTVNDVEEHFMRRVTVPGRYSKSSIKNAVSKMLKPHSNQSGSSMQDIKVLVSRAVEQGTSNLIVEDEQRRSSRRSRGMTGMTGMNGNDNHEEEESYRYSPQIRAWKQFITHCNTAEFSGTESIGLIEATCHKYDQNDDKCYVTGTYVLGMVRKSNVSLLRKATPVETLENRMTALTTIQMTPFSLSATDEVLVASGLLMEDVKKTEEGRDILIRLLNMNPLNSLDGANVHFVKQTTVLLDELCDVLDRGYTDDPKVASLTFECHSLLSTHVRRFGVSGFKNIVTNVLAYHVPMRNDGAQLNSTTVRARQEPDASPRLTSAAAAYGANTLRDVATSACHLSISIALCLTMTLRRFLHGTGPRTKVSLSSPSSSTSTSTSSSTSSSSSSSSVDVGLRHQLSSLLRIELIGSVLLRAMVLRDLGDCNIIGKHPHDDTVSDGRMTTMRIKRLIFDEDSTHLNADTSHGGHGFLELMEHNASTNATVEGEEDFTNEVDGPLDLHMHLWGTSVRSKVEGKSVLGILLLYYADIVPMEGSQESMLTAGGGRVLDPRQWFHDVSALWSDRTATNQEIPLSMAHVVGFLMSRGQIETLAKVSAAMLSGVHSNELGGSSSSGGSGDTWGSSGIDGSNARNNLSNLRSLGECWLTTSDRLGANEHDNMDRAFRYLLRACPTKQGDASSTDDHVDHNSMMMDDADDDDDADNEDDSKHTRKARRDRIRYLMAMMRAFVAARRPKHAVFCARAAITSIGSPRTTNGSRNEDNLLSTLWRSIFTQCVAMGEFDDAWLAIGSNPNQETRSFCVSQLVSAMYDAHSLDVLLRLPLVHGSKSNLLKLEKALERKATFTPLDFQSSSQYHASQTKDDSNEAPLTVTVHHYLYAIHIKHKNYRKAAEIMYSLAKAAVAQGMPTERALGTKRSAIGMCTDALTTATSTLRLLPSVDERYILDRQTTEETNAARNGMQGNAMEIDGEEEEQQGDEDPSSETAPIALKPIWIEDLQRMVVHNRCRLTLLDRYEKNKLQASLATASSSLNSPSRKRARSLKNQENEDHGVEAPDLLAPPKEMTAAMISTTGTTLSEYELAIETAVLHTLDQHRPHDQITPTNHVRLQWLHPIVTKLASHLIQLRLAEKNDTDDTLNNNSTKNGRAKDENNNASVLQLEHLLKNVLYRLDGVESNHALHRIAADAMLSVDDAIGLPMWLINSFKGGVGALRYGRAMPIDKSSTKCFMPLSRYLPTFSNGGGHPTALIEVYMKYGRLADACDIASTIISNVNGSIALEMKTRSDVGDSWMSGSIIPHDVLDQLMARCETTLKSNPVDIRNAMVPHGSFQDDGTNEANRAPDERVVHKLNSSLSYLKDSLLNYFDGRLEADSLYAEIQRVQMTSWNRSMNAANAL